MRKEKLDDIVQRKLSNHSSEVPGHIWNQVASQIQQGDKKPVFWLFDKSKWVVSAAAVTLAASVLIFWPTNDITTDTDAVISGQLELDRSADIAEVQEAIVLKDQVVEDQTAEENSLESNAELVSHNEYSVPLVNQNQSQHQGGQDDDWTEHTSEQALVAADQDTDQSSLDLTDRTARTDFNIPALAQPLVGLSNMPTLFNKNVQCADFRDNFNTPFWSIAFAHDMPIRNINSSSAILSEYVQLRENTELPISAFSLNMNLGMIFRNGLSLRSGLNYSRIKEGFNYDLLIGTETTIVQTVNEDGEIIEIDTTTTNMFNNINNDNFYEILDLPLMVGFEKSNEKFGMGFYTGLSLNLLFNKVGNIVSPENQDDVVGINSVGESGSFFSKKLGVSYYASTLVTYNVTNRIQMKFEPYFRYYPASFANSTYAVHQNYYIFGGQVGMRYLL